MFRGPAKKKPQKSPPTPTTIIKNSNNNNDNIDNNSNNQRTSTNTSTFIFVGLSGKHPNLLRLYFVDQKKNALSLNGYLMIVFVPLLTNGAVATGYCLECHVARMLIVVRLV